MLSIPILLIAVTQNPYLLPGKCKKTCVLLFKIALVFCNLRISLQHDNFIFFIIQSSNEMTLNWDSRLFLIWWLSGFELSSGEWSSSWKKTGKSGYIIYFESKVRLWWKIQLEHLCKSYRWDKGKRQKVWFQRTPKKWTWNRMLILGLQWLRGHRHLRLLIQPLFHSLTFLDQDGT